jgi:hypothetical protein
VAEILRATGIRLFLASELPVLTMPQPLSPETPEQRAEHQAEKRGEIVFVATGAFADLEDEGRRYRFWSNFMGERPVRLDDDPTSQLVAIAEESRDDLRYNVQHDLRIGGDMDLTRWEFYSAPFTVELSVRLREGLAATWKERVPRLLPGESEHVPPLR